jgi:lauroyl/myristoyl acyltransferase
VSQAATFSSHTREPHDHRAEGVFWQNLLFWEARNAPIIGKLLKPLAVHMARRLSEHIRDVTTCNGRRIFGPNVTDRRIRDYARGVTASFIDFVTDVARYANFTDDQLRNQIESITGQDHYNAARALRKGAIIATAHMGSFEAGAAALRSREPKMHVVFKRDVMDRFDLVRRELRERLGVIEAPVDEGWVIWLRLREALLRDEVVMLQADRVMTGQKGVAVPFLHGHLEIPTGPVKLALASGAPIIPVLSRRMPDGRVRLCAEPAIIVEPSDHSPHPALLELAAVIEKHVRACPEQWLLMHRAFCEDAAQEGPA